MKHLGTVTLETERLILRPLTLNDFDAVHSGASNIENTYLMLWGPNSEEQTECFIEKTALNQYQELSLAGVA